MRRQLLFAILTSAALLTLVLITTFVALQRQEIRQRAATNQEFIQATQAQMRAGNRGQTSVVVSNLNPQLEYGLRVELAFDKSSNAPGDVQAPGRFKKVKKISENKTYKLSFAAPLCTKVTLNFQLFSRDKNSGWKRVGDGKSIDLETPCKSQTPQASVNPEATESATVSPTPQTTEENFPPVDPEAEDIGGLEDDEILNESPEPVVLSPTPQAASPTSGLTIIPSPLPPVFPSPSATPALTPSPSNQAISQNSPSPTPVTSYATQSETNTQTTTQASTTTTSFGELLTSSQTNQQTNNSTTQNQTTTNSPANQTTQTPQPSPTSPAQIAIVKSSASTKTSSILPASDKYPFTMPDYNLNTESPFMLILTGAGAVILTAVGIVLLL